MKKQLDDPTLTVINANISELRSSVREIEQTMKAHNAETNRLAGQIRWVIASAVGAGFVITGLIFPLVVELITKP